MQQLIFQRQGKNIVAKIIGINLEPLDARNGRQVVFFCQDKAGKRYRVPKTEAVMCGNTRKEGANCNHKKRKKQPRKDYALDWADQE